MRIAPKHDRISGQMCAKTRRDVICLQVNRATGGDELPKQGVVSGRMRKRGARLRFSLNPAALPLLPKFRRERCMLHGCSAAPRLYLGDEIVMCHGQRNSGDRIPIHLFD